MSKVKSVGRITPGFSAEGAPSPERPRFWLWLLVAGLLTLHFALAVGSKRHESTTSDELAHLTAGVSYWKNHDYRLQPENGILPQRWAALPAWLAGAKFPQLDGNVYWQLSDVWNLGYEFFYTTGEDHFPRLMAGRAMIALFSVATGLLVFCWSRHFFGNTGAFVSLGFFVFCPTFLANGALVTSDVCMAFFFLAATGAWWRQLHDGRNRTWALSAVLFGLAFVAKYSAVLLLPMMAVMAVVRLFAPGPLVLFGRNFITRGGKIGAISLSLAGHLGAAALVIWAFYGFRYPAVNPALPPAAQFVRTWEYFEGRLGVAGTVIHAARMKQVLPEAFLYGFAYVLDTVKSRSAFLNGAYSETGWPSFFLWTFLLKTTIPLMIACGIATWLGVARWCRTESRRIWAQDLYRATPLVALFVIYGATSITSHLNIGHRHILPLYPVLFIGVGALGAWCAPRRKWLLASAAVLLGWHVASAIAIAPHFLAYFNEIAGGPENGRHHLIDSSLDWGQDLPSLKTWLTKNNTTGDPVFLSYFGTGEPTYYHIDARRLAFVNTFDFQPVYVKLEPGIYCISATIVAQVYSPTRGQWTGEFEAEFRRLRELEPTFAQYTSDSKIRTELEGSVSGESWRAAIRRYDMLRLARLCHYLRIRQPEANAGHSILIYRLSADEIDRATKGSLAQWNALIEEAALARPR